MRDKLRAQYRAAKARLRAADDDVSRASRDRLVELMKLSERERFAHLEDPALTPQDRVLLRRSVAAALAKPRLQLFGHILPSLSRRRFRWQSAIRKIPFAAIVIMVGTWTTMVWLNTGQRISFNGPLTLDWTLPSGETGRNVIAAGDPVILVYHRYVSSFIRNWYPGQGYATAKVNTIEGAP